MCLESRKMLGYLVCLLAAYVVSTKASELTFELPDSAKECFYAEVKKNDSVNLEFQVVTGGQYDVDVVMQNPQRKIIYQKQKQQYDSFQFVADIPGVYVTCFSNEFSTFSHKVVYMDWQVGDELPLPGVGEHLTAMTQLESSAENIHKSLNTIVDFQTHHRLRESTGRKNAEDLNERVLMWSVAETLAVVCIAIGQVMILKTFFSERKPLNFK